MDLVKKFMQQAQTYQLYLLFGIIKASPEDYSCSVLEPESSRVALVSTSPDEYLYEHFYESEDQITHQVNFRLAVSRTCQHNSSQIQSCSSSTHQSLTVGFSGTKDSATLSHVNCSDLSPVSTSCWVNGFMSPPPTAMALLFRHVVAVSSLKVQSLPVCSITMVFRYMFERLDSDNNANYDKTPRGKLTMMSELVVETSTYVGFYLQLSPYNAPAVVKPYDYMTCGTTNVSLDIKLNPVLKARTTDVAGYAECDLRIYNHYQENIIKCNLRLISSDSLMITEQEECECINWMTSVYVLIVIAVSTIVLVIISYLWYRDKLRCTKKIKVEVQVFQNGDPQQTDLNSLDDYGTQIHKPLTPEPTMEPESSINPLTSFQTISNVPFSLVDEDSDMPSTNQPRPLRLPHDPFE